MGLVNFIHGIADAMTPPELRLFQKVTSGNVAMCLGVAARHNFTDVIGSRRITASELATELCLNEGAVHRVLRALASQGVFTMHIDGTIQNNATSRAMSNDNPMRLREAALYFTSLSNVHAWANLEHSLKTGESAFDSVHGKSVWDWFDEFPDEREVFGAAMMGGTTAQASTVASLYPFAELRHVCDVGGGQGTLLSELLIRFPKLTGTLCDRPGVLEAAVPFLQQRGVLNRVTRAPGDFFQAIVPGHECYLLKNILHDWNDDDCVKILKTIRAAAPVGARVLIFEFLQERNDATGISPMADLQMLVACDGRERSRDDFTKLLSEAGFKTGRIVEHPIISLIEGIAV